MNFLAAMFLTFMNEEESFWLLVAVMNEVSQCIVLVVYVRPPRPCLEISHLTRARSHSQEPYDMRVMYSEDMGGVHESLYIIGKLSLWPNISIAILGSTTRVSNHSSSIERLVQKFMPKLFKHLEREHVDISMIATQWIMTLFSSTFKFDMVSRVWDSFL